MGGRGGAFLVAALCWAGAAGAAVQELALEPGFPWRGGGLLIPATGLDASGRPTPLAAGELTVLLGGEEAAVRDLLPAVPTAVMVVTDQALTAAAWAGAAASPGAGDWLGLTDAGAEPTELRPLGPWPAGPVAGPVTAPAEPRTWDAVLVALRRLAEAGDAPGRRVVLVVGNLRGEDASEHPVATCAQAARELAIPVYGAVTADAGHDARRRLERLAAASGGMVLEAATADAALARGLARIAAAQGLVLDGGGVDLPAVAVVNGKSGDWRGRSSVTRRPQGRWAPGAGLIVAVILALLAAGAVPAWRWWRGRTLGYLVAAVPGSDWRWPVPAAGLTIGREEGNGLVLTETRVSKYHAAIRWHGGAAQLIDLRSTNGTQVNGQAVRSSALTDGDTIVLGDAVTVVFRLRNGLVGDRK